MLCTCIYRNECSQLYVECILIERIVTAEILSSKREVTDVENTLSQR